MCNWLIICWILYHNGVSLTCSFLKFTLKGGGHSVLKNHEGDHLRTT